MELPHFFDVDLQWNEQRKGTVSAPQDGLTPIEVATPPAFPSGHAGLWSPEHFFVAAVSSCLMTTFLAIAENSKLEFEGFTCRARGVMDRPEKGFKMTEVVLYPTVTVRDEQQARKAQRVLEKAEEHCLISNSINSKVTMEADIRIVEEVS
jgi:peroxiredoxin-like protein